MCRDSRTTEQLEGSITAASTLARQIENDAMSTPQQRNLAEELHNQINKELTTLDCRRNS
ncbi:hypothetical protein SUDANB1_07152 [Streptomyces sp. enrichment culture]|uniref:hypothetical protein n=1 Tax=Streptomyces sp. enrichment culture TaxID=1795815 RepID=UPI003F568B6A